MQSYQKVTRLSGFPVKMFRPIPIFVVVFLFGSSALCKVRTSKRPGFMLGNPLYDPVWEDDTKIVGGNEVIRFCL